MTKLKAALLAGGVLPADELLEANATLAADLTAERLGAKTQLRPLLNPSETWATGSRITMMERAFDLLKEHVDAGTTEPLLYTPALMAAFTAFAEKRDIVDALCSCEPASENPVNITTHIGGRAVTWMNIPWDLARAALLQLGYALQTRAAKRLNIELLNLIQSKLPAEPQKDIDEMVQVDAKGPCR